ncbi:MAG TPA: hypothetical protein VGF94_06695 [Kofleriaceae bacterium]
MTRVLALGLVLGACSVPDVDYTGKQCPCPSGYSCSATLQTCTRGETGSDAAAGDSRAIDAAPQDGMEGASCLDGLDPPFTNLQYATPEFADFATAWTTDGGAWSQGITELDQIDSTSQLAVAYHTIVSGLGTGDQRLVVSMHATAGGDGDAIELALHVDAMNTHMYHCNWEPTDGAFLIQRTDTITLGPTLVTTTIDTSTIPNYQPSDPVTMEFQVHGTTFSCCLHGIPGATLQADDGTYTQGDVGVKTYEMAGAFHDFQVYTP